MLHAALFALVVACATVGSAHGGPALDGRRPWVFAYGSLANRASRALEGSDDPASLVDVQGMAVAWDGCAANGTFSPLSIHRSNGDEALVHGIVFPVDEEAINNIDQRESEYIRQEISFDECVAAGVGAAAVGPLFHRTRPDSLEVHGGNLDEEKDAVFAYITPQRRNACRKAPISQAYIDVIVSGLLSEFGQEQGRDSAVAFLRQVCGWKDFPLVNDRPSPLNMAPLRDTRRKTRGKLQPALTPAIEDEIDDIMMEAGVDLDQRRSSGGLRGNH